ncbi:hypothetical protein ACSTG8_23520, partial [Vibrio parahaemolyticus]
VHAALFVAMALFAGAAATLAVKTLSITPATAAAVGLAVLSVSLAVHFVVAARAQVPAPGRRASTRTARPRNVRRATAGPA